MTEKEWIAKICKGGGYPHTRERLEEFLDRIADCNTYQEKYLKIAMADISQEETDQLESLLAFYCQNSTVKEVTQKYLNLIDSILKEQIYFIEQDRYRCSTFQEVREIYKDSDYMDSYMVGLGLSTYLWYIHRGILRFFKEQCGRIKKGGRYLEIGPGHGEYFVTAMKHTECDQYLAIDISQTSVEMTRDYCQYRLTEKKQYTVLQKDFFDFHEKDQQDVIVMGEVLEHVEEPLRFLKKIHEIAHKDTFIFISTAINAPQPDHIYHFHNIQEVLDLFQEANLVVRDQVCIAANHVSIEKALKKKYAIVTGFVLEKCAR